MQPNTALRKQPSSTKPTDSISTAGVAKKYNIHYSAFLKQIKEANIPIPPSGYWTKLSFGKPVEKMELSGLPDSIVELATESSVSCAGSKQTAGQPKQKAVSEDQIGDTLSG